MQGAQHYLWNEWMKGRFPKSFRNNLGLSKNVTQTVLQCLTYLYYYHHPQFDQVKFQYYRQFSNILVPKIKPPWGVCRDEGCRDFQAQAHADLYSVNAIDLHSMVAESHNIQLFLSEKLQSSHCET